MSEWVIHAVRSMGYFGVVLLMFAENVFPPIPSEVVMPLAGVTAVRSDDMEIPGVIAAGTAGSVLGALVLYWLGWRVGEDRIKRWADRHGKWLALSANDVERARQWFNRHDGRVVFLGRLIPGIRSLISIPAGADRMPLGIFLLWTTLGTAIWTALLVYAGVLLGNNWRMVEKWIDPIGWVVFGSIALAFLWRLVKQRG
jgi:membrane protein DedA with SNARE-associated domain